jgi:hypothetical protein
VEGFFNVIFFFDGDAMFSDETCLERQTICWRGDGASLAKKGINKNEEVFHSIIIIKIKIKKK